MDNDKKTVALFCPPLSVYPEQPDGMSKCKIVECPHCNNKMWFSEKKEVIYRLARSMDCQIIFACYICFYEMAKKDPRLLRDNNKVEI